MSKRATQSKRTMEICDSVNNGPLKGQKSFKVEEMRIRSESDKAKKWLNIGRAVVYPEAATSEKMSMQKTKSKRQSGNNCKICLSS